MARDQPARFHEDWAHRKKRWKRPYRISSSCSFPRQYKPVPHGTFSSAVSRLILFLNDSYDRVSSSSIGDWMVARTFFSPLSLTLPPWIHPEFWGLQFVLSINWQWVAAEKILTLSLRITLRFLEANKSLTEAKKSVVSERLGCWWKLLVKDRCGLVWKHLSKPSGWHQWYHWGFCPSCQSLMAGNWDCFLPWIYNDSLNFRAMLGL